MSGAWKRKEKHEQHFQIRAVFCARFPETLPTTCAQRGAIFELISGLNIEPSFGDAWLPKLISLRFCSEYGCWIRGRWPRSDAARQAPSVGPRSSGRVASEAGMPDASGEPLA